MISLVFLGMDRDVFAPHSGTKRLRAPLSYCVSR